MPTPTPSYAPSCLPSSLLSTLPPSPDPRVAAWPLMSSPWPTLALTALYLCVVWAGPRVMARRPPLTLRGVLVVYNAAMMALNLYIAVEVGSFLRQFLECTAALLAYSVGWFFMSLL